MSKNGMRPVHPGEILREELEEIGMSANALAKALGVPGNRITYILKGQRGVTADTALRLSRYLGTTPELWLNLQKTFELRVAEIKTGHDIVKHVKPRALILGWHTTDSLASQTPHSVGVRGTDTKS